jgi:ribulose-5-phosphate 4-epimerase/fuculose-1-phosphate aldolase
MQFRVSPQTLESDSAEQWQARIDLAAAHRLAFMHGFSEGIFNHLTFVVPGRSDRYYQIPFGMHWSEVTASSFMEVGIDDGKVRRGEGEVERSCYCIHAPIHKALPQAKAVFHTHMPYASALEKTMRDIGGNHLYQGPTPAQRHFDALKRILDRKEPDYAS